MSRRDASRKYLPAEFTRLDLPVANRLVLAHAQKVNPDQKHLFDNTTRALAKPLLDLGNWKFQYFEPLFFRGAQNYQYWFIFDRAYCFQELRCAVEAKRNEVSMCRVVARYPVAMHMHTDAILMVRDHEVLERYSERSPIFGWLSMIAVGQPTDEMWSYCFLPPRRVARYRRRSRSPN